MKGEEELIKAALIEFGDKGYENASLNNILKEAGISKGTFYYHFKNRRIIYIPMPYADSGEDGLL